MTGTLKASTVAKRSPISFTYRLGFIVNVNREPIVREVEARFGFIRPEWTILLCLSVHDGLTARDICGLTGHLRNGISRGVALLLDKRLVTRRDDAEDGRRMRLFLTEKGREAFRQIEGLLKEREERLLSVLPAGDRERFGRYLDLLCDQLSGAE